MELIFQGRTVIPEDIAEELVEAESLLDITNFTSIIAMPYRGKIGGHYFEKAGGWSTDDQCY